jgi:hypothetical protein
MGHAVTSALQNGANGPPRVPAFLFVGTDLSLTPPSFVNDAPREKNRYSHHKHRSHSDSFRVSYFFDFFSFS